MFTAYVFPVTANGLLLNDHDTATLPPVPLLGVAVSVVVCPGNKLVSGDAVNPTAGNCRTVRIAGAEVVNAAQPALPSWQR